MLLCMISALIPLALNCVKLFILHVCGTVKLGHALFPLCDPLGAVHKLQTYIGFCPGLLVLWFSSVYKNHYLKALKLKLFYWTSIGQTSADYKLVVFT